MGHCEDEPTVSLEWAGGPAWWEGTELRKQEDDEQEAFIKDVFRRKEDRAPANVVDSPSFSHIIPTASRNHSHQVCLWGFKTYSPSEMIFFLSVSFVCLSHQSIYAIRSSHFLTSLNLLGKNQLCSHLESTSRFSFVPVICFCTCWTRLCSLCVWLTAPWIHCSCHGLVLSQTPEDSQ